MSEVVVKKKSLYEILRMAYPNPADMLVWAKNEHGVLAEIKIGDLFKWVFDTHVDEWKSVYGPEAR